MKTCPKCGGSGPFFANRAQRDGLSGYCKVCHTSYQASPELRRARHVADPEKEMLRLADPEKEMLRCARYRARKFGVPFDLTLDDIVIPAQCPILGIPLLVGNKGSDNSPTLDRTRPELGYVKGNVSVMSSRANRAKSNLSPEELLRLALYSQKLPSYIPDYSSFVPGKSQVLYSGPFWDHREIAAAVEALCTGKWLTSGEYVARFQNAFERRFHVHHAFMTNSGSSANLVMLAALKKRLDWQDGDEIIVSPVGFPTTIAPIVQNGLKPVFADIELRTLNFDLDKVFSAIGPRTKAIFVSPVLGNPPDMDLLRRLDHHAVDSIRLIGDHCDSLGSRWGEILLSEQFSAWTTSFYPAHHAATGEGGMVCSNDKELIDIARSISSWGRACYCVGAANLLPCGTCNKRFSDWFGDGTVVDHKYVFDNMGYNLKPLDLQGAIGLAQLEKFDLIEIKRRQFKKIIGGFFAGDDRVRVAQKANFKSNPCWFGVPLICTNEATKNNLVAHLEKNLIQTRPYFAGNILRHPGYRHLGNAADFPNADEAMKRVLFIGCSPHYTPEVLEYIGKVVHSW